MKNRKVLIVDDSNTDLKYLEQIINGAHYTTLTAKSGEEAISMAKSEHPDMIFLDIIMQDMDGFSTCRQITRDPGLSDIPVVFVSSKNQRADHMWASKQGAKALISKPYNDDEILNQLIQYA
jgi:twitching motility two-component system response regulator PilH